MRPFAGPGLPNAKQLKQIRLLAALTERPMPDTDDMSFGAANHWLIDHFALWMAEEERLPRSHGHSTLAASVREGGTGGGRFCTFTNSMGGHCRPLDQQYNATWCVGRAKGQVGDSCMRAWVAPASQPVFEEAAPEIQPGAPLVIDWAAQQGEAEHAQLAVRYYSPVGSAAGMLRNITIQFAVPSAAAGGGGSEGEVDDGTMELPVAWLSARHVGQVIANSTFVAPPRGAGWYPDPLLPIISSTGVTVPADLSAALWLTLSVPGNARPGNYSGRATLRGIDSSSATAVCVVVALRAEVWDLQLPSLATAAFQNFWQFQFQPHPFGARYPAQIRGVLDNYYGNRTESVKLAFFELLCQSRVPPVGYTFLRNLSDMVSPLDPGQCTGIVPAVDAVANAETTAETPASAPGIMFSIMSISDLFGHKNPSNYSNQYFEQLWTVLDPVVDALNRSGHLPQASVYGFDEAHPRAVYEPLIQQLFGAVKSRYNDELATVATLHYCPSLTAPIDILVQSYADFPNGTSHEANYGVPGQHGEFCEAGFPATWAASAPRRRYFQYHCFSPRSARDGAAGHPTWPDRMYGAMNSFVDFPRIHNRMLPWWATANDGVSGWLYFEVSEWRFDTGSHYPAPTPYGPTNLTRPMVELPSFVRQPNDGFVEERAPGTDAHGSRLSFNVNKYYANVYGGGTTAGDGVFLYPGRSGPLSGARLETWRDGSEDAEIFMRLPLQQRQALVWRLVRSIGEWWDDPALLEHIRREAAHAVMAANAG